MRCSVRSFCPKPKETRPNKKVTDCTSSCFIFRIIICLTNLCTEDLDKKRTMTQVAIGLLFRLRGCRRLFPVLLNFGSAKKCHPIINKNCIWKVSSNFASRIEWGRWTESMIQLNLDVRNHRSLWDPGWSVEESWLRWAWESRRVRRCTGSVRYVLQGRK